MGLPLQFQSCQGWVQGLLAKVARVYPLRLTGIELSVWFHFNNFQRHSHIRVGDVWGELKERRNRKIVACRTCHRKEGLTVCHSSRGSIALTVPWDLPLGSCHSMPQKSGNQILTQVKEQVHQSPEIAMCICVALIPMAFHRKVTL